MKKLLIIFILVSFTTIIFAQRFSIIEDFESDNLSFYSYQNEDLQPDDYSITTLPDNIPGHGLKVWGNTWKVEYVNSVQVSANTVFSVDCYYSLASDFQGIGFGDDNNIIFYSFSGENILDIESWVTVYQGSVSQNEWHTYMLPIADDFMAYFDYYPVITRVIYINNEDDYHSGEIYFDNIKNITEDLPQAPSVSISYSIGKNGIKDNHTRTVEVQFYSVIEDIDSSSFTYFWQFGDGETSTLASPAHTYTITDDHSYSVTLKVTDDTNMEGYATTDINVDYGETSFPITMNFVGDIMLGRYVSNLIQEEGVNDIFEPTKPYFGDDADISVANLECPLTYSNHHHPTKPIFFKANPQYASGLQYAGIDIVNLANNHIYDYLEQGIYDTQQALDEYGILYAGADYNSYRAYRPLLYSTSGKVCAFLSSSDRTGQYNNYQPYLEAGFNKAGFAYMTPYYVKKQIDEVRDIADYVIVQTHSGSEYSTEPGANYDKDEYFPSSYEDEDYNMFLDVPHMWDREIRHFFIDQGADLVVCHHPHIIQGVEVYNGKLIAHSLGNFIFDLSYSETFPSMILKAYANETGFYKYQIIPVYINNYVPEIATGELGMHILDYLSQKSRDLNTILDINTQDCIANVVMDTLAMDVTTINHTALFFLYPQNDLYISEPIKLEKNGSISKVNLITPQSTWYYRLGRSKVWFGGMEDEGADMWRYYPAHQNYDETEYHNGNRSLKHFQMGKTIQVSYIKNGTKLDMEKEHTLFGYVKGYQANSVNIGLKMLNDRNFIQSYYTSADYTGNNHAGSFEWTKIYRDFDSLNNLQFFDIYLKSDLTYTDSSAAWFDDIDLIEWDDWKIFNPTEEIISPNDYYYIQFKTDENAVGFGNVYYSTKVYHSENSITDENTVQIAGNLSQNYPNPFFSASMKNRLTKIKYSLKTSGNITLKIYNLKGQLVKTLVNNYQNKGNYISSWNGKNSNGRYVASGVYLYQLKVNGNIIATKKAMVIK